MRRKRFSKLWKTIYMVLALLAVSFIGVYAGQASADATIDESLYESCTDAFVLGLTSLKEDVRVAS